MMAGFFYLLSCFVFLLPLLSSSGKVSLAYPWVHGSTRQGDEGALVEQ